MAAALDRIDDESIIKEFHQRGETIEFLRKELKAQSKRYHELLSEQQRLMDKLTVPTADIWSYQTGGKSE